MWVRLDGQGFTDLGLLSCNMRFNILMRSPEDVKMCFKGGSQTLAEELTNEGWRRAWVSSLEWKTGQGGREYIFVWPEDPPQEDASQKQGQSQGNMQATRPPALAGGDSRRGSCGALTDRERCGPQIKGRFDKPPPLCHNHDDGQSGLTRNRTG